jgi:hypothetical protein
MNKLKVGFYSSFGDKGTDVALNEILSAIKDGEFKESIERLRNLRDDEYDAAKRKLPHFAPSGLFGSARRIEFLTEYVPVIILDVDHLGFEEAINLRNKASLIEHTIAAFLSPGGQGFKILVLTDSTKETHLAVFNQVVAFYEETLNIKIDRSGKDISRACFVSYDPDICINENVAVFKSEQLIDIPSPLYTPSPLKIYPVEELSQKISHDYSDNDNQSLFEYAVNLTENIEIYCKGRRNNFVYKLACNLNRFGMELCTAENMICAACSDLPSFEIRNTVKSAYRNFAEHNIYGNCQNNYHPLYASTTI